MPRTVGEERHADGPVRGPAVEGSRVEGAPPSTALGAPGSARSLMYLQRSAGNRAVAGALTVQRGDPPAATAANPVTAVTFEGVLVTPGQAAQRESLERLVNEKGWDSARGWMTRFVNMDIPVEVQLTLTQRITAEALQALRTSVSGLWDTLSRERDTFLREFETRSVATAREVLAKSKQEILNQIKALGIKEDTFLGFKTGGYTMDAGQAAGLKGAIADLIAKRTVAETAASAYFKAKREAQAIFERNAIPSMAAAMPELVLSPELHARVNATKAEGLRTANEYDSLAADKQSTYPILATVTPGRDALAQLQDLAARKPDDLAAKLAFIANEKLDNIATVEGDIGGRFSVWKEPRLRELTKRAMSTTPWQGRVVEEKAAAAAAAERNTQLFMAAVAIGLGLIAAIPTAGASVGVAAAVTAAAVGSMAVSIYSAYDKYQEYSLESAAQGTDFDKAKAISQGDPPEIFWLAVDVVAAIADVHAASAAFKTLKGILAEAKAAKTAEKAGELLDAARRAKLGEETQARLLAYSLGDTTDSAKITNSLEQIRQVFRRATQAPVDAELAVAYERAAEKVMQQDRVAIIQGTDLERRAAARKLVSKHGGGGDIEKQVDRLLHDLDKNRANGFYDPATDTIVLRGNRSAGAVAATLAHELAHREQQLKVGLEMISTRHQEFQAFYAQQQFLRNLNMPAGRAPKGYEWLMTASKQDIIAHVEAKYTVQQFGPVTFKNLDESADWIVNALKARK